MTGQPTRPISNPFASFLERQGVAVLDGGFATALEARGHTLSTDLWSARFLLDDPDEVVAVHRSYLEAGADCISTASYQASFHGFEAIGLSRGEAARLFERSVTLATTARDAFWSERSNEPDRLRPLVAASVGPYGAFLADGSEYVGRYGIGREGLDAFHRERFAVLAESGADVIACETIPSALEAEVLLGILDDTPDTWAWLSFTCRDESRLSDGSPFADAVALCAEHDRVAAVGVNCTAPRFVARLLSSAAGRSDLPLMAYPNSGERYDARAKTWSGAPASHDWVEDAGGWAASGARLVGGCCRVGPDTIRALRARLVPAPGRPVFGGVPTR